jgi:CRP-like cAMP-binding protein
LVTGEVLYRIDYPAERVYFVKEGIIALEDAAGVRVCLPGTLIGTEAFDSTRYTATARALTNSRVCVAGAPRDLSSRLPEK